MAYTKDQRALAVAIVGRHGGMTREALIEVAVALGVDTISTATLHRWLPKSETEKKKETETEKKESVFSFPLGYEQGVDRALDDVFEEVARRYLAHAVKGDVVKDTKGKEAVIAAATAVDKMRLLRGLPTEIVEILPSIQQLHALLTARGSDPAAVFNAMIAKLDAEQHKRSD